MAIVNIYQCEVCGVRAEGIGRMPLEWSRVGFTPGLLENTKHRPDKHYCTNERCRNVGKALVVSVEKR